MTPPASSPQPAGRFGSSTAFASGGSRLRWRLPATLRVIRSRLATIVVGLLIGVAMAIAGPAEQSIDRLCQKAQPPNTCLRQ